MYKLVLEVLLVTVDEIAIYPLSLIDNTQIHDDDDVTLDVDKLHVTPPSVDTYIPDVVATAIPDPESDIDTQDDATDNINETDQLDPYVDDTYTTDDVDVALLLVLVTITTY